MGARHRQHGFTLIELLVVILIIIIVSVVALPTVVSALSHRQVSEAARILQGGVIGARDAAIHSNAPAGIRLLPDPLFNGIGPATRNGQPNPYAGIQDPLEILAFNRFVPLEPSPSYTSGMVSIFPVATYATTPYLQTGEHVLVLEQSPANGTLPNEPTSWNWNVRVGDRVTIGTSGKPYTVVGPLAIGPAGGNAEMFVNGDLSYQTVPVRLVGSPPNVTHHNVMVDYLYLVNGLDDDKDGFVDTGHNGLPAPPTGYYSEIEAWDPMFAVGKANMPYSIQRRPVPSSKGREIALPSDVVIDGTGWGLASPERSRFGPALNASSGYVDLMVNPDGTLLPTTLYSTPAGFGMGATFVHLWLAERSDLVAPDSKRTAAPYLPLPVGMATGLLSTGAELKGEYRLVTLFTRTGMVSTAESVPFDSPSSPANGNAYDPGYPFGGIQQGISGGN